MSKPSLTLACGLYDRMLALYTDRVQPAVLCHRHETRPTMMV